MAMDLETIHLETMGMIVQTNRAHPRGICEAASTATATDGPMSRISYPTSGHSGMTPMEMVTMTTMRTFSGKMTKCV